MSAVSGRSGDKARSFPLQNGIDSARVQLRQLCALTGDGNRNDDEQINVEEPRFDVLELILDSGCDVAYWKSPRLEANE